MGGWCHKGQAGTNTCEWAQANGAVKLSSLDKIQVLTGYVNWQSLLRNGNSTRATCIGLMLLCAPPESLMPSWHVRWPAEYHSTPRCCAAVAATVVLANMFVALSASKPSLLCCSHAPPDAARCWCWGSTLRSANSMYAPTTGCTCRVWTTTFWRSRPVLTC